MNPCHHWITGEGGENQTYVETKEQKVTGCQSCNELLKHMAGLAPVGRHTMVVVLVPRGRGHLLDR